jgi:hypothetical protein
MTIVRSLGVATLVALMSAHREAADECETPGSSFDQAKIDAIEAYLHGWTGTPDGCREQATKSPRSYN